jgi:hypothetical protein
MTGPAHSRHGGPGGIPCAGPTDVPLALDFANNDRHVSHGLGAERGGDGVRGEGGATPSGSRSPLADRSTAIQEPGSQLSPSASRDAHRRRSAADTGDVRCRSSNARVPRLDGVDEMIRVATLAKSGGPHGTEADV